MKYFFICLIAIILSCAGSSTDAAAENSPIKKNTSSDKKSCLSKITDPDKWYSTSQVASLTNQPEIDIEKTPNEKYSQLQFNWKSDRTYMMKVGKIEMEIPTNNTISITIKSLDEAIEKATKMHKNKTFTYAEYFDSYHSQVTEEDKEYINEKIDEMGEEDKDFDSKLAKKVLAMAKTENYTDVTDLGDDGNMYVQLAPGLRETRLAVLHGNVVLLVNVDVSDEDGVDYEAARKIAKAVIALCD